MIYNCAAFDTAGFGVMDHPGRVEKRGRGAKKHQDSVAGILALLLVMG